MRVSVSPATPGRASLIALALAMTAACKPATDAGSNSAAPPNAAAPAPTPAPAPAQTPAMGWRPDAPNPAVTVALAPLPTQPGDIPDSHDVAFLKRFQAASIVGYAARPYDRLSFYDATGSSEPEHALAIEGQVTRIVYRVPAGHTALEVLRNYEDLARAAGLAQASEQPCVSTYGGPASAIWDQLPTGKLDNPGYVGGTNPDFEYPRCYFTARGLAGGAPLMVGVYVAEKHKFLSQTGMDGKPLAWKDGEVAVIADLVSGKAVAQQMVTVKAADMADALAAKGFIDLYGVYFDTDQAVMKAESNATLDEVASLLRIDRALKIEVSGHTDSNGGRDHNLALSQARAAAIVEALVTRYGIDSKRLVARGYGDTRPVAPNDTPANMAKNRRVELRKL